jgi:predicted transcriptional regulator
MKGKRTDLNYAQIMRHVFKYEPITVQDLHTYLTKTHGITLSTSRSRLIKKLLDTGYIQRIGSRGWKCSFKTMDKLVENEISEIINY